MHVLLRRWLYCQLINRLSNHQTTLFTLHCRKPIRSPRVELAGILHPQRHSLLTVHRSPTSERPACNKTSIFLRLQILDNRQPCNYPNKRKYQKSVITPRSHFAGRVSQLSLCMVIHTKGSIQQHSRNGP